jgi:hypothetical protein
MAHICDSSAAPVITAEGLASKYTIHYATHKYCLHIQIYNKDNNFRYHQLQFLLHTLHTGHADMFLFA